MPSQLLPPDVRRDIQALERRVAALEKRVRPNPPSADAEILFSYPGALTASESPPVHPRNTGGLSSVVALLGTPGSTPTVVEVRLGGVRLATVTLAAGAVRESVTVGIRVGADQEPLTVALITAAADARDLTVQLRFT